MKDSLRRQAVFDDLITEVLARFASAVGAEIDEHIRTSLREIAQFIGVDYAYLVQISTDSSTWSATHEWRAPDIPSHFDEFQDVPMGSFDWNEKIVLAGDVVRINALDEVPPAGAAVRKRWKSAGFKSVLQVPLRGRGGSVRGCLGLSAVRHETTWAEADIKRLRLVSETVANALERQRAEEELRESETRFRTTFEQAPVGIPHHRRGWIFAEGQSALLRHAGIRPRGTARPAHRRIHPPRGLLRLGRSAATVAGPRRLDPVARKALFAQGRERGLGKPDLVGDWRRCRRAADADRGHRRHHGPQTGRGDLRRRAGLDSRSG